MRPRVPVDAELKILKLIRVTNQDLLIFEMLF